MHESGEGLAVQVDDGLHLGEDLSPPPLIGLEAALLHGAQILAAFIDGHGLVLGLGEHRSSGDILGEGVRHVDMRLAIWYNIIR